MTFDYVVADSKNIVIPARVPVQYLSNRLPPFRRTQIDISGHL